MKKALVVIDLQNDYFCGGKMELDNIDELLLKTNELVAFARVQEYDIYFIQHYSTREGASFFVPHTNGVELHEALDISSDVIIKKNYPNSFRETELKEHLDKNGIEELIVCGAMTHMCIDSTVRASFDLGYKTTLVSDACATRALSFGNQVIEAKDIQLAYMASLNNIFCRIRTVEEITTCQQEHYQSQ